MSKSFSSLQSAQLSWQDATPVSEQFDDIYFNQDGGVAETEHVFIQANQLPERFTALSQNAVFSIGETGFGTGLNFLCASDAFLKHAPSNARLHFISVEKYPLKKSDLERALAHWPQFAELSSDLCDQYPIPVTGFHRLDLAGGRIQLTLMYGEALPCFGQLDAAIDAWFLDGFAPSKNPEMWQQALFEQMSRLSREGTTLATFTAAGFVRRGLIEAGFAMRKVPGFGRKREMLAGIREAREVVADSTPWFSRPYTHKPETAVVVGAGLAGCTTAYALARQGIKVTVIEATERLASAASGNRQGALYIKLPLEPTKQGELHACGLLTSQRWLNALPGVAWDNCGLVQLAINDKELQRQQRLIENGHYSPELVQAVDAEQASELAGSFTEHSALYFPHSGWVNPPSFCQALVQHPNIEVRFNTRLTDLQPDTHGWQLVLNDTEQVHTQVAVLATANAANQFTATEHLPLKPIRGQVSHASATAADTLKAVVCAEGYISPAWQGEYCYGSSFKIADMEAQERLDEHQENHVKLARALPHLAEQLGQPAHGRVAWRCTTPDYLPIVGPAPDIQAYLEAFAPLRKDRKWQFPAGTRAPVYPGLYLNVGHGSKGLITCPQSAELLTALICNQPAPLSRELCAAIHPARFLIKKMVKGSI